MIEQNKGFRNLEIDQSYKTKLEIFTQEKQLNLK